VFTSPEYTVRLIAMIEMGTRLQLRKKHPCGSDTWVVTRVGGDVGLRCEGCGRQMMLARSVLNKRVKQVLSPSEQRPEALHNKSESSEE
jgi:hypothetical protein